MDITRQKEPTKPGSFFMSSLLVSYLFKPLANVLQCERSEYSTVQREQANTQQPASRFNADRSSGCCQVYAQGNLCPKLSSKNPKTFEKSKLLRG